jgi:outer membrane protein OmpA-like peptidoglycan-associated protein
MKRPILLINFILVAVGILSAQSGFEYTRMAYQSSNKAESIALPGAYALSTQKYLGKSGEEPGSEVVMLQLGDNYRLNGQPVESALWYGRGISQARTPEDHLHYAYVLKTIGQCEEANVQYHQFLQKQGLPLKDYCLPIEEPEITVQVTMRQLPYVNSEGSDFAGVPWGDQLLFTSDREFTRPGLRKDSWTLRNFTSIFFAEKDKSGEWRANNLLRKLDSRFHDGTVIPHPNGNSIYFTRSNANALNGDHVRDLQIHEAIQKGSSWKQLGPLPFNNKDYGVCHPAISADAKVMVFASDMPGGFGGMDLYKVEKVGSVWGTPINLGAAINSPGNEIFPFISGDGYLFYASDGIIGYGGLDVFAVPPSENGHWQTGFNLGNQVNTSYDDFALVTLPGRKSGYLSSNRPGGLGLDDIYGWNSDKPLGDMPVMSSEVVIVDAETGLPIKGALIEFGNKHLQANEMGRQKLVTANPGRHALKIEAPGFYPAQVAIDLPSSDQLTVKLRPAVLQPFIFDPRDLNTKLIVENPIVEVFEVTYDGRLLPVNKYQDTSIGQDGGISTAAKGPAIPEGTQVAGGALFELKDRFTQKPLDGLVLVPGSQRTDLIPTGDLGSKDRIEWLKNSYTPRNKSDYKPIPWTDIIVKEIPHPSSVNKGTGEDMAMENYNNLPWMLDSRKRYQIRARAEGYLSNLIELSAPEIVGLGPLVKKPIYLEPLILGIKESDLKAEASFVLDGIYYDYDKADIRTDAQPILGELSRLMHKYPGMIIELSSHTDSRGNDMYNLDLSQRRADSAVAYLGVMGISSDRLFARGYGERKPVNHCKEGKNCSEEEHQLNRRTEFKIIRME